MEVTATMTDRRPGSAAPRRISILGSTGSIGCSTIDLIERNRDGYVVEALTANNNVERLIEQARSLRPQIAVVAEDRHYAALKDGLAGTGIAVAAGAAALSEAASRPVDWTMAGIVGAAGLAPTLAAIRQGGIVAVANKETLVCAGELVLEETRRHGATLLPVDSEHNAIFQVFDFEQADRVSRIILTASGGPFRTWPRERMEKATPEEAVAHPNWSMGAKISVDSATLMNKGLEVIEAYYLFPVDKEQIEVVIHPQSVVHSMVEYVDGSVLAQMGTPDMRTPIAFAMGWPQRLPTPSPRLDFGTLGELSFEKPDHRRFPALSLAFQALRAGGTAPTVLNAANEIAVGAFLAGRIGFLEIASIVADTLGDIPARALGCLEEVGAVDDEARRKATLLVERAAANV